MDFHSYHSTHSFASGLAILSTMCYVVGYMHTSSKNKWVKRAGCLNYKWCIASVSVKIIHCQYVHTDAQREKF